MSLHRFDIWDVKRFNIFIVISIFCSFFIFTFRKLKAYIREMYLEHQKNIHQGCFSPIKIWVHALPGWFSRLALKGQAFTFQSFARFWLMSLDGSEIRRTPVDMVNIPLYTWFYRSQVVVWDFFYQLYGGETKKKTIYIVQGCFKEILQYLLVFVGGSLCQVKKKKWAMAHNSHK